METQKETTWDMTPREDNETVFKGKTVRLTAEQSKMFITSVFAEKSYEENPRPLPEEIKESKFWFLPSIIQKRIEVMNLPIKFTDFGYLAMMAFADNPGKAVVVLIDALTRFEGRTIGTDEITELYPNGFYCDDTFADYIDNYLKPRKVKWAEIY